VPVTAGPIRQSCPGNMTVLDRNHSGSQSREDAVPTLNAAACAGLLADLTKVTLQAADAILTLTADTRARIKPDGSPVTAADEAAEAIICEGLVRIAPGVPIISEEQTGREKAPVATSGSYFLVDPLDGTREFIAGRNEYTVNIAVMTNGAPMLGIICAPALGHIWRGVVGHGADWIDRAGGNMPRSIHVRRPPDELTIMISRSHLDEQTRAYIENIAHARLIECGSSVKFCHIAEGNADLYPRFAPTHDWDIAAGHAILQSAGGRITTPSGTAIAYGTKELLVPAFVARGEIKG
jgi:3'(2'), 5'-bisphosphate nucleotidase